MQQQKTNNNNAKKKPIFFQLLFLLLCSLSRSLFSPLSSNSSSNLLFLSALLLRLPSLMAPPLEHLHPSHPCQVCTKKTIILTHPHPPLPSPTRRAAHTRITLCCIPRYRMITLSKQLLVTTPPSTALLACGLRTPFPSSLPLSLSLFFPFHFLLLFKKKPTISYSSTPINRRRRFPPPLTPPFLLFLKHFGGLHFGSSFGAVLYPPPPTSFHPPHTHGQLPSTPHTDRTHCLSRFLPTSPLPHTEHPSHTHTHTHTHTRFVQNSDEPRHMSHTPLSHSLHCQLPFFLPPTMKKCCLTWTSPSPCPPQPM